MTIIHFVPTRKPLVAITFDDGPTPKVTDRIVSILAANGAKGTFFMTGKAVDANPALANDVKSAGHEVGVHGYSHKKGMKEWSRERVFQDFSEAKESVANAVGFMPKLIRPPFGNVSENILSVIRELNMDYIGWSLNSKDWLNHSSVERIIKQTISGTIVVFHDGGMVDETKIGRNSLMLEKFLKWAVDKGYSFVTVSELINQWDCLSEVCICGKRLLGVRSFKEDGNNFVTPMWWAEDVLAGLDFSISANDEFTFTSIPPMSNVDDWIPYVSVLGDKPLSIFPFLV